MEKTMLNINDNHDPNDPICLDCGWKLSLHHCFLHEFNEFNEYKILKEDPIQLKLYRLCCKDSTIDHELVNGLNNDVLDEFLEYCTRKKYLNSSSDLMAILEHRSNNSC